MDGWPFYFAEFPLNARLAAGEPRRAAKLIETPGLAQKRLRERVLAWSRVAAVRPSAEQIPA